MSVFPNSSLQLYLDVPDVTPLMDDIQEIDEATTSLSQNK